MEVEEFPQLEQMRRDFQKLGLAVLAINQDARPGVDADRTIKDVRDYLKRQEFGFLVHVDRGKKIAGLFGVRSTWATVLVGPDGKIAGRWWQLEPDSLQKVLEDFNRR